MKNIIIDLDGTLTIESELSYQEKQPNKAVIEALRTYHQQGFSITIFTSRNMNTYKNSIGKINIHTLPTIIEWLEKHKVPYDEIVVGKPWCGFEGFYVDDKAIRPSEFATKSYEEIVELLAKEKDKNS